MPVRTAQSTRQQAAICQAMKRVRERTKPFVTQTELSARTGISQQLISRYESTVAGLEPTASTIFVIETALGVPHGSVLRAAGMIDDATSVRRGIELDPELTNHDRETVLVVYDLALRLS